MAGQRFMLLQRASDYGAARTLALGKRGFEAQAAAIERLGGSLEPQYVVSGTWDVVAVVWLPDRETALAAALALAATVSRRRSSTRSRPRKLEAARSAC